MTTASTYPPPRRLYDLDITIVSAKHLKNVNWRNGDLKPYVILWVDPDRRLATKPDDSGSTRPVWNERFLLPLSFPPHDSLLTLELFHSKPSDTPRPLIGTLTFQLSNLLADSVDSPSQLRSFDLRRPSGRPHGKIRLKLALIERPNHSSSYYYSSPPIPPYSAYSYAPPPPPPSISPPWPLPPQSNFTYPDSSYTGYYPSSSYYPPRSNFERFGDPGPSAPVEYTPYDYHRRNVGNSGLVEGMGGLGLEERGGKNEEDDKSDMGSTTRNDGHHHRYGEY